MYPDQKYVEKCLQLIEDKLNWGPAAEWHNDVFLELSDLIQQQTQVLLSPTTLKRLWGKVNYPNAPSITTLNTMAQFAGYVNWREFKSSRNNKPPKSSGIGKKINENLGVIMLSASIMTVVFISLFSLKSSTSKPVSDLSKVEFDSRAISLGLPNSVVFDFNLEGIRADSIRIQQYWDVTKTISLRPDQKQATGQYYYPGYFRAKLIADDQLIKEHDLFIKSGGWIATVDYDPIPKYINEQLINNGRLTMPASVIDLLKNHEQPTITAFHYVDDFKVPVSGDNFILKTAIRNTYRDKWAVCQRVSLYVLGTKSAMIIPLSIPGCVSEIGMMLSDVYLNGKENDLSGLGIDLSYQRAIKIEVRNKHMSVFADDSVLFTQAYSASIGDIVGFRYRFIGAGEVDYLRVSDLSEKSLLFDEQFLDLN